MLKENYISKVEIEFDRPLLGDIELFRKDLFNLMRAWTWGSIYIHGQGRDADKIMCGRDVLT